MSKATKINILQSALDEVANIGVFTECYQKLEASKTIKGLLKEYPYDRNVKAQSLDETYICLAECYLHIGILVSSELTTNLGKAIINIECALSELVDGIEVIEPKPVK